MTRPPTTSRTLDLQTRPAQPLPVGREECDRRGWGEVDIVLVSGDAYVDHPSFGVALIGRLLVAEGYRVAILPQPRYDSDRDFRRFGRPRLFFGVSGGNLDSIVANYSANGKVRDFDAYSPDGNPWRTRNRDKNNRYRPDRAVLHYANLARRAYPDTPIILGGIEASLRRFIHFDYKQNRLRGSHLSDAKADLLVYGMGEKALLQAAELLSRKRVPEAIDGTCVRIFDKDLESFRERCMHSGYKLAELPGWQDIGQDIRRFMDAERIIDRHARARSRTVLIQKQQAVWVAQFPPAEPLSSEEMDRLYQLPFSRLPHPSAPQVPAHTMIKDSVTIVRGCYGNCSFCAITRHQGPSTTSRSVESIVAEVSEMASRADFSGTISDLGGPTANLYGTMCSIGSCPKHDCLYPEICKNLIFNEGRFIDLLDRVSAVPGVNNLFISSGLRIELLQKTRTLLEKLLRDHTPGNLKIAPEHTEDEVLALMHKESHAQLISFMQLFRSISRRLPRHVGITPYIISAHPGCSDQHTANMVAKMKRLGLTVRQFQDFTPTPGTLSTAMYVTGIHRDKHIGIEIARDRSARSRQRRIIEREFIKGQSPRSNRKAAIPRPGKRKSKKT
ncbi:MAG: YgiQ family radical SAM protein [Desulfofustis sp.]|nr:YgiQ family radical SAM protein [Desulfofustis sp.]